MQYYIQTPDYYNDYIAHHGVKGMKWGVRKNPFQSLGRRQATGMMGQLGIKLGKKRLARQQAKANKNRLEISKSDSSTTKKVKDDYNNMSNRDFKVKYSTSKRVYKNRVKKYGDPYMNAPLSKLGKNLTKKKKARYQRKIDRIQKKSDSLY